MVVVVVGSDANVAEIYLFPRGYSQVKQKALQISYSMVAAAVSAVAAELTPLGGQNTKMNKKKRRRRKISKVRQGSNAKLLFAAQNFALNLITSRKHSTGFGKYLLCCCYKMLFEKWQNVAYIRIVGGCTGHIHTHSEANEVAICLIVLGGVFPLTLYSSVQQSSQVAKLLFCHSKSLAAFPFRRNLGDMF